MSLHCVYFSDEAGCDTAYSAHVTAAEVLFGLSRKANEFSTVDYRASIMNVGKTREQLNISYNSQHSLQ